MERKRRLVDQLESKQTVLQAMRELVGGVTEVGIDISEKFPKPWADEVVRAADVVVIMGCGDACPIFPRQDLPGLGIPHPAGLAVEAVRPIRDQIGSPVRGLLDELQVSLLDSASQ